MSISEKKWLHMMIIGERLGCHQLPERSFFIKGYQFPVCARCTGVFISTILAFAIFPLYQPSFLTCIILCGIMFVDWFIQYLKLLESTNIRRLITGLIGGYGFTTLQMLCLRLFITYFVLKLE